MCGPVNIHPTAPSPRSAVTLAKPTRPEVLLLTDDDPDLVRFLEALLRSAGFRHIHVEDDPTQAMTLARRVRPDLVLTDVVKDGMTGFDLAEGLRATPETASAAIVFCTARSEPHRVARGRRLGEDYIVKPFDPIDLVDRIVVVLERTAGRRGR